MAPADLPGSLMKLAAQIGAAGGPRKWVVGVVLGAVVAVWLRGVAAVTWAIGEAGANLADVPRLFREGLVAIFGPPAAAFVDVSLWLLGLLGDVAGLAGPLAPAVVVLPVAGLVFLTGSLGLRILGTYLPI